VSHGMLIVPSSAHVLTVTVGQQSGSYGYDLFAGFGAVSPPSFRGAGVFAARSVGVIDDFFFTLSGSLAKSFFKTLRVAKGDGTFSDFESSSATHSAGAETTWRFPFTGVFAPWDNGDVGASREILVLF
jgi:hypothetical protein